MFSTSSALPILLPPSPLFFALWLLWAGLLFGGFLVGWLRGRRQPSIPTWARLGSSLVLVTIAWGWAWDSAPTPQNVVARLFALGMTLGLVGDLAMAGWLKAQGMQRVLLGMVAFGLGHIAYIAGLVVLSRLEPPASLGSAWLVWGLWLLIGAAGWYLVVQRGHPASALRGAALPYALLLASTAGFATVLALHATSYLPLAIGATLFLLSDLLLAAQLFNDLRFPLIDDAVWLLYGPGQMLLVCTLPALAYLRTLTDSLNALL